MSAADLLRRFFSRNLVQFVPGPRLKSLFVHHPAAWRTVLPVGANVLLTWSGSAALYRAGQTMQLGPGDTVLVPDYNCGHEFEPFLRLGAEVGSYPVSKDLQPDLAGLEKAMSASVRAVLVTHYFGFPQELGPVRALCDRADVHLIEDCAHVLRPGKTLGKTGDIVVLSFRKTLPLPDGGALVLNHPDLSLEDKPHRPPALNTANKLLDLAVKSCLRPGSIPHFIVARAGIILLAPLLVIRSLLGHFEVLGEATWFDPDDEDLDFPGEVLTWAMSGISQRILQGTDIDQVAERRRQNFQYLLNGLTDNKNVSPLYNELPPDGCPMYFPVVVADPESTYTRLAGQGISTGVWWEGFHPALTWEDSPAADLKRSVLAIPIHQELSAPQLDRILEKLAEM